MSTNSNPEPIVRSGEILAGRYLVERARVREGIAHIVRAEDTLFNTVVALKILPRALTAW
jgi:hypothetical protein